MAARGKCSVTRSGRKGEERLYDPVKRALEGYFGQNGEIALSLEVTADGFSPQTKHFLNDDVLFLIENRELRPDIFGRVGPDARQAFGYSDFLVTAEIKDGSPIVNDVFQAKKYGELYQAFFAFLICTKLPDERVIRLLKHNPVLLFYSGTFTAYLCRYSEESERFDWWFSERQPRKKNV
jgi:hypothetical protein